MSTADQKNETKRAIVLLSGGMDSATTLAIARAEGFEAYAMTFRYGQRHAVEIEAAKRVAGSVGAAMHRIVDIDLRAFGGSALTDDVEVPKDRDDSEMGAGIPITYVPARNTIFLSFALAWAEVLGAEAIYIGVNTVDYSGYPDCRPEFIRAFETLAVLATRAGVEEHRPLSVRTPLMDLSKAEIVRRGVELGVDYAQTLTCYDPTAAGEACGHCDACQLRLRGFRQAGLEDPAPYAG